MDSNYWVVLLSDWRNSFRASFLGVPIAMRSWALFTWGCLYSTFGKIALLDMHPVDKGLFHFLAVFRLWPLASIALMEVSSYVPSLTSDLWPSPHWPLASIAQMEVSSHILGGCVETLFSFFCSYQALWLSTTHLCSLRFPGICSTWSACRVSLVKVQTAVVPADGFPCSWFLSSNTSVKAHGCISWSLQFPTVCTFLFSLNCTVSIDLQAHGFFFQTILMSCWTLCWDNLFIRLL